MRNIRQLIEQVHLIFLDHLGRKIDKRLYTLKGGCNLRFYFKSFRYSEDIDFDTQIVSKNTLDKNINNILESKSFNTILQSRNIMITNITTPKQTETTQRWKVALTISDLNLPAHTKIEFSRRGSNGTSLFEAIDSDITQDYHLPPIFLNHYDRATTIAQKIGALAGRNVTQARDIFDLYLLLGEQANNLCQQKQLQQLCTKALANLESVTYQDFQSQVITYLFADYQQSYSAKDVWQQIVTRVRQVLTGNQNAI